MKFCTMPITQTQMATGMIMTQKKLIYLLWNNGLMFVRRIDNFFYLFSQEIAKHAACLVLIKYLATNISLFKFHKIKYLL